MSSKENANGKVELLNPDGLIKSPAFSNVAVVSGNVKTIYIGGQNSVDENGNLVGEGDFAAQSEQVLKNIKTAVEAVGADVHHIIKMNIFIAPNQDIRAGFEAFGRFWGRGHNPPLVTVLTVSAFATPGVLVEIDGIAVVPE